MTGGLPEGLVTNTEEITGDIERVNRVTVEDISQLWKGELDPWVGQDSIQADNDSSLQYQQESSGQRHRKKTGEFLLEDMEQQEYTRKHHGQSSCSVV